MGPISWIIIGLLAGGLARRAVGSPKRGCLATIAIGVVGAFLAGAVYRLVTGDRLSAFDDFSLGALLVAFLGAAGLLLVLQAFGSRR